MTADKFTVDVDVALGAEAELLAIPPQSPEWPDEPLVWIIGGYKGKTAALLADGWPAAQIEVFEPQRWAYELLKDATSGYENVMPYPFGLGSEKMNGTLPLGEWETDACSMLPEPDQRNWNAGTGDFVDVANMFTFEDQQIDLALLNCEGGEFVILPRLRETGLIERFEWLLIQWHAVYVGMDRVEEEMMALSKTHERVDKFDGIAWTLWRRR